MIQRLRRKFIMVNMALVSLILVVVIGASCFSSYQSLRFDTMQALHRSISRKENMPPPKLMLGMEPKKERFVALPVFCVMVYTDGSVEIVSEENVQATDALAKEAARLAALQGKREGVIQSLGLRYLKEEGPEGTKMAFAERSGERQSIIRMLIASICLLVAGLAAFLIVSVYLARWALRPVEKAWQQQRQFVADASHELKTPITVILANTGILMAHQQETIASQRKWVEYTQAEAMRMKKLVDDLLFLAKNDDAQQSKLFNEVDFSFVVSSGFLIFESIAFEQGIVIGSDICTDVCVLGDKGQLQQLVMILLDNACKYAPAKGRVFISLRRVQEKVKLSVHNTGPVISLEEQELIFDRFYRSDKSRAREAGGVGLGLAIAKRIVTQHKGRIEVESLPDKGTTFVVTLPAIPCVSTAK